MAKTKAAGLFLVNKENKILVGHPTNHDPNFWSIPKGKVDSGEDYLDAAIRETYEETNVKLSYVDGCLKYFSLDKKVYKHKKKELHPFVVLEVQNNYNFNEFDIKCNSNVPEKRGNFPEMDDFDWVTIDKARNILHQTQIDCLDVIDNIINNI